jgi:ornithine cyclodeaminase/alanine dehydrogenase-like protein (mu-crystallin family)
VTKGRRRKSGGHAAKECVLTLGIAVEDIATARLVYEAIQVAQSVKDLETRKHPRAS